MAFSANKAVEGAVRRDRLIVLAALGFAIALSWGYILAGAGMAMTAWDMTRMAGEMKTMTPVQWDAGYAALMLAMWWVMMVAMMLPSATPMILLYAAMTGKQRHGAGSYAATALFASGYLAVWAGFSLIAVALQWGLEALALLSPMLVSVSPVLGGMLLLAAGLYQLTPLKQACLRHCRSPLQFVMTRWQDGPAGALRMGAAHGAYCVGCCWFLMGLLFFGGVMNLYWIAGLAVFVLIEKTVPSGHWLGYLVGGGLTIWGIAVLSSIA